MHFDTIKTKQSLIAKDRARRDDLEETLEKLKGIE